jgi:hypothetical protein
MRRVLLCLALVASQAQAADFEGIITGKPTGNPERAQTVTMYLGSSGVRMEISGLNPGGPSPGGMTVTTLWQLSDPNSVYILNPANKMYLKRDMTKAKQAASTVAPPKVERVGATSLLGHTVQRVKLTFANGKTQEVWVDTSLHFPASATAFFREAGTQNGGPWKAMEQAGVAGIPLKDIGDDGKSGWEATSIEKKSLPASLFQIPAGYTEAKSMLDMLPADQQAARKAKLDALTPEQRARIEEMMKKAAQ